MDNHVPLYLDVIKQDNLMSGMQDISSLAERYHSLADHSKGLQTIVQRMKREVLNRLLCFRDG